MSYPTTGREALERVLRIYDSHREEATPPFRDYPSAAEAARSFVASLEQRLAAAENREEMLRADAETYCAEINHLRSRISTLEADRAELRAEVKRLRGTLEQAASFCEVNRTSVLIRRNDDAMLPYLICPDRHTDAADFYRLNDRLAAAERVVSDLLRSADASWESNREGHDWPEACDRARAWLASREGREET